MSGVTKKQFMSGAFWKIVEQFSSKGVSFVVSLVLARLLMPEDYGLLALTTVFITFADIFIDGGFTTALVQKKEVDGYDYGSVFLLSMGIAIVLYVGMFVASPWIADFYEQPELQHVLRVMCLSFFAPALSATRSAYLTRKMMYHYMFRVNIISNLVAGGIGIFCAWKGMGVWALVIQRTLATYISAVVLVIRIRWDFPLRFSRKRIGDLLVFSAGVLGSSLLNYLSGSISNAIIGKYYSMDELGYSDKGSQFPMQASLYTFGAMSSVLLPTISSCQEDIPRVKHILRKVTGMTAYLIAPIMAGMAVTAREIILLLLTEKWLPCVRIMQYSCLYYLATPFMLIHVQLFFAMGKSFLRVKTEIIRLILSMVGLAVFAVGLHCSIDTLSLVTAVVAVLSALVTFYEVRKLIGYRLAEFWSDVWKHFLAAAVMGAMVVGMGLWAQQWISSALILLLLKGIFGVAFYIGYSIFAKSGEFYEILELLHLKRKHQNGE